MYVWCVYICGCFTWNNSDRGIVDRRIAWKGNEIKRGYERMMENVEGNGR